MNNSTILLIYAVCYTIIFILTWVSKRNKSNRLFNPKGLLAENSGYLMALHFAGIFWLGLVPGIFSHYSMHAFLNESRPPGFYWLLIMVLLSVIMFVSGFMESHKIYVKHENITAISNKFFSYYFFIRILFLCAYELFFRGFLLFDCIKWFGIFPAILISTSLTVLIHVFTNKKEMWACIPFGVTLCICCIVLNAVWPAIVLHLVLSLAYEIPLTYQFIKQLKFSK